MPQSASDLRLARKGSHHASATNGDSKVPPMPPTASNPRLARHAAERCGKTNEGGDGYQKSLPSSAAHT
eukprot:CAMPEP_0177244460 /NCGR_PEP_ID=MMETSP0367-20130122/49917_1 /TAXON_ID=447022 ORGANISM="Scrippsiella hangoei-like, Strain SHHI-4" /NCGR_SAMPLE_ID=MMETSP0367 /ASSEMBLY_ACC=CAM_ASM_000362 /LENGTH=68 /DNA_ID=CAMNT_0018696273 /DNA_START=69 /DNA_END=271 /DNA_ORIENTATION=-